MAELFAALAVGVVGYARMFIPVTIMAGVMALASILVLLLAIACGRRSDALRARGFVLVCPSGLVLVICLTCLLVLVDPELHRLLAAVKHPPVALWRVVAASAVPALALLHGIRLLRADARRDEAIVAS